MKALRWNRLLLALRRRSTGPRVRRRRRGVALILVLGALTILTVMLTEFQDETSADLGSALVERDKLRAEYAAKSGANLSRLLLASEPVIRRALGPILTIMGQGARPPQLPVWEFADQILSAFNGADKSSGFELLSGVSAEAGENLGFEEASFDIEIVDEDSKINVNAPATGNTFAQERLAAQLLNLMVGEQYDPLFEERDLDNNFSDRQAICGAIIDYVDPDQSANPCAPGTGAQAIPEDSYYQLLKPPYSRKNAALDSLEELRFVRGIGDDFWHSFVDPDPENPDKRVLTVWGEGAVNVNTANPQALLALICANAVQEPPQALCTDPVQAMTFLSLVGLVKQVAAGAPLFPSGEAFVNAVTGQGKGTSLLDALGTKFQPVQVQSRAEFLKVVTLESKVFSIYSTGRVESGRRHTRVRLHSVIDFRGAPSITQIQNQIAQNLQGNRAPPGDEGRSAQDEETQPPNPLGRTLYFRIQ